MTDNPRTYDSGTQKLLDDLATKPQSFDRDEIIRRAKRLKYHSYKSDDGMCTVTLVKHLAAAGFTDLAKNAMDDKYEQDREEGRKWAEETEEGRQITAELMNSPSMRATMEKFFEHAAAIDQTFDKEAALAAILRGELPDVLQEVKRAPPPDTGESPGMYAGRMALEQKSREIAEKLKAMVPPNTGFTLFLYDFGAGGNMAYLSTAKRDDMRKMVKEWLDKTATD